MRILSKRQVKELVLYSPQHVARLEKAGQFPKRVKLGLNRVGWIESEVLEWCCQTNANQSLFSSDLNLLGCAETVPLGQSSGTVVLEI